MLFVFRNGGRIGKEYHKLTHFIEKGFIHLPVLLCYMIVIQGLKQITAEIERTVTSTCFY